jgi:transcriptional regulator with XRE-family HTH domain
MPKSIHRPEYDALRRVLRRTREAAGMTQAEVSLKLDRAQSFVSKIESGVRRLDVLELRDLCALLGKDLAEFLRDLDRELQSSGIGKRSAGKAQGKSR